MSVNKYQPHLFVLPEDDANRQLANGFQLHSSVEARRMQVLAEAGGWQKVVDCFKSDHIHSMLGNDQRFMVLLVDFDGDASRIDFVKAEIPEPLRERVFVLGVWSEPEKLKRDLGSYEAIGMGLARECHENCRFSWNHELLKHNAVELDRLADRVRPFLFR